MKSKVSEWGNSHGVRVTGAMMAHLKIQAGDEIEINLTNNGIEIIKSGEPLDYLATIQQEILNSLLAQTNPVSRVEDPYSESNAAYIVIDINPCSPVIREVSKGTENSFSTLADAKEAARQKIQSFIAEAQKSLSELRQIGIDNITYIAL